MTSTSSSSLSSVVVGGGGGGRGGWKVMVVGRDHRCLFRGFFRLLSGAGVGMGGMSREDPDWRIGGGGGASCCDSGLRRRGRLALLLFIGMDGAAAAVAAARLCGLCGLTSLDGTCGVSDARCTGEMWMSSSAVQERIDLMGDMESAALPSAPAQLLEGDAEGSGTHDFLCLFLGLTSLVGPPFGVPPGDCDCHAEFTGNLGALLETADDGRGGTGGAWEALNGNVGASAAPRLEDIS
jgi:hypothetical protein